MITNLTGYNKRSIATQTGDFTYEFSINLSNTTGSCLLGFSGASGNVSSYNFVSGKIYDGNSRQIYSYQSGATVNINGAFSSSGHNIYGNYIPISLSAPRNLGPIEYFYINPQNCIVNNLSLYFSGDYPSFSISGVNFSGNNPTGSGYFINSITNNNFKIFSGYDGSGYYPYSGNTGNITSASPQLFYITKNFTDTDLENLSDNVQVVPYTFYTNFGTFSTGLSMITTYPITQILSANFSNGISGSGNLTNSLSWANYKGSAEYTISGLPALVSLTWVSGAASGNFTGVWGSSMTGQNDGANYPMSYVSGLTGYTGYLSTFGSDGIFHSLNRLVYDGTQQIVQFGYSGYNTGYSILITGN